MNIWRRCVTVGLFLFITGQTPDSKGYANHCTDIAAGCFVGGDSYCGPTGCSIAIFCYHPGASEPSIAGSCLVDFREDGGLPTSPIPPQDSPTNVCGSIVDVDTLSLGESVDIVGSPFQISYLSDRMVGRTGDYSLHFVVTQNSVRSGTISYEFEFAGRTETRTFDLQIPNQSFDFVWDGKDSGGNLVPGAIELKVTIRRNQDVPVPIKFTLGAWKARRVGLGGWTFGPNHFYDTLRKRVYYGYGQARFVQAQTFVRTPSGGYRTTTSNEVGQGYFVASVDGTEVHLFDLSGRHLETRSTRTGNLLLKFDYLPNGQLSAVTDHYGNVTQFLRPSAKKVQIVTPFGKVTNLILNNDGLIAEIKQPGQKVYKVTYHDALGMMKSFERPNGAISQFTYDTNGYLVRDESSAGSSLDFLISFSNNFSRREINMSTAEGRNTKYNIQVDAANNVVRTETLPGNVGSYRYEFNSSFHYNVRHPSGETVSQQTAVDPRFIRQIPNNSLMTVMSPQNVQRYRVENQKTVQSDPANLFKLLSETETKKINNRNWQTVYTDNVNEYVTTSPLNRKVSYRLEGGDQVSQVKVGSLAPVNYTYDSTGKLLQIQQGDRVTDMTYDEFGFVQSLKNALGQETTFKRNAEGLVTKETLPDGRVFKYAYDTEGNLVSIKPNSQPEHYIVYNFWNLISSYLPPELDGTTYETRYEYNRDKQITRVIKPDGVQVSYNYSSASGLLSSVQAPEGSYLRSYNSFGQLQTLGALGGISNTFTYDGNLLKSISQIGVSEATVSYEYQNLKVSNISVAAGGTSASASYSYDNDDLLIAAGQLTVVRDVGTGVVASTQLAGVQEQYSYDSTYGELNRYTASFEGVEFYREEYSRDLLGRIVGKVVSENGTSITYGYVYDGGGRLVEVYTNGTLTRSYKYDGNSNRTLMIEGTRKVRGKYDDQDRILSYGARTYTYTGAGDRLTRYAEGSGNLTTYTYDSLGALKQAIRLRNPAEGQVIDTFDYENDGLGRRLERRKNGVSQERYVYDEQGRLVAELDKKGRILSHFVYGTRAHVPDYMVQKGVPYKFIQDHLGSVRLVVNAQTGEIRASIKYDEFGRVDHPNSVAIGFQPFGFAGGIYDVATRLVRFGARDYDAETGRWTSKDPILFNGMQPNLYGYNFNDPVNFIDSNGKHPVAIAVGIGAVVGAVVNVGANWATGNLNSGNILSTAAIGAISGATAVLASGTAAIATATSLTGILTAPLGSGFIGTMAAIGTDIGLTLLTNPPDVGPQCK